MKKYSTKATNMKLYPINRWAYISESKVDKLLGLLYDDTFVSNADYDIISQVYNYLNVIFDHVKDWNLETTIYLHNSRRIDLSLSKSGSWNIFP